MNFKECKYLTEGERCAKYVEKAFDFQPDRIIEHWWCIKCAKLRKMRHGCPDFSPITSLQ